MYQQLHFDFNHFGNSANNALFLKVRGEKFPLRAHTQETLQASGRVNKAVSVLLSHNPNALTHFVDVPQAHILKNCLTRIQVVGHADESDPNNYLPPLYHVSYMTHIDDYKSYFVKLKKKIGKVQPRLYHAYGLDAVATDDPWEILVHEYGLNGPVQIAKYLAGQHPMTMSNKPQTHLAMENEHIYPVNGSGPDSITQCNNIVFLAQQIKIQGEPGVNSGFARIKQAVDGNKQPMIYEFNVGPRSTGDAVLIYDLTDITNNAMAPATALPVQTSRNDSQFQNQTWSVNQGEASKDVANQNVSQQFSKFSLSTKLGAAASPWAVSPNTSTHGITVDQGSINFDPTSNTFSVDAYNNFLRIVGAYVQFFADTDMKTPIDNPMNPKMLEKFQTSDKTYISMITSVNTIMGIPMPTDPVNLKVQWPDKAQAAKLMFGGAGTWNYDAHTVWPGFIETGIFCFGVPLFMMALSTAVTDTQWYKDFVDDTDNIMAAVGVGSGVGGGALAVDIAEVQGLKGSLFTFGDIIAGILVKKGMEALTTKIMAKVAASQIAEAAPFVGWVLRALSIALDVAEMAVSLGEVLSSPAVIEVDIKRQMPLTFTLHPDPAHGEAGKPATAIWPAVADHYRIMVNYKNGTGFEAKGNVPLTQSGGSSNTPVSVDFTVPWGGQMQIIAAVYSKNGWLCGKYQSDWLDAIPDTSQPGKTVNGNITELLVPLTVDTQYNFMQKIAYNAQQQHYWWGKSKGATAPADTVSSLNPGNVGHNLAQLSGITINETAYVIGYTWQASGENIPLEEGGTPDSGQMFVFQNQSVLSDPQSRNKFPDYGFKTKPGLAYDIYGGSPKEVGPLNFVIDTRNASTGYLRLVDLMNGSSKFNLDSGLSYGTFTLGDIDAVAVHPNGYIVATNWASHRMQILRLPEQAVPDASAPAAALVAGKGVEQGLLLGPIALAISPDGKIYVLESLNNRVQAFDIVGNPAPSFKGEALFTVANGTTLAAQLDQKLVPDNLITAFLTNRATDLFYINPALSSVLDAGVMTMDVINAFADNMIYLAYQTDNGKIIPDPTQTSYITVAKAGSNWTITDPSRKYVYALSLTPGGILVQDQFTFTEIIILQKGASWQLKDLAGGKSYLLTLNGNNIDVAQYLSYFSVNPQDEELNYCDIAIESKGYVYVLAYSGDPKSGSIPNTAYVMDVYTPQGEHLFRTPDSKLTPAAEMEYIAAGKITVDLWRNLFALNYEKISGPSARTEPSVSQWIPSPPLFDIDLTAANIAMFNNANMPQITAAFAASGNTLSSTATCTVIQTGQHWKVNDPGNSKNYDVITTIGKIYVYSALV
ncbi:hypothetical protein [Mucilaginibacter sp. SP1R1]|uniref:hypothetical protein n=1 Tax=Mucilaginibacter sp. SP1R1 TaxID=2723091 RepID=UPI00160F6A53|nr:hypothetical protein [Mucilaginibacter sp. SP1R1]MBB6148790.1 hypothetical protein [Mucilaginibacter sp. SP1R1]